MADTKLSALTEDASLTGTELVYVVDNPSGTPTSKKSTSQTLANLATPEGTAIKSTGEAGGTKFLREDGDGTCSWQTPAGAGDMVLADVQSVTGLKTFDTTKLAVKGSSTGSTAIASANASATDYTATLQAVTGTIALTSDISATSIGALIGGAGDATPNDTDFVATSLTAGGILKKITWTNVKVFLKTYFDTVYQAVLGLSSNVSGTGFTLTGGATPKTLTVALDASVSGTNTGDQTLPVKATGAEADTGTDDAKFLTSKAAKDSHNIPSVAPGTSGNVLTSNGTDWTSAAPTGGSVPTKSIRYIQLSGVTPNGTYPFSTADISGTIANVRWTSSILPVGSARTLDIRKNGTASTDSIFTSDTPISKATNESATNGKYTTEGAVIDNGTLAENDVLYYVFAGGSTSGTADDFISYEIA